MKRDRLQRVVTASSRCAASERRRGAALVVVLWVVGLLSMLVAGFAFDAHIQARLISYQRKRTKADYLARSGMEMAQLLMTRSAEVDTRGEEAAEDAEAWWFLSARRLAEGLAVQAAEHPLGEGTITLDIVPEPARRNVNLLKEEDWERIFELTRVPEASWPELIDSFMDWLDSDDEPRLDGAETEDFYARLEPPYAARNGPLDTVGELLLIRGFSRSILFGGPLEGTEGVDGEPYRVDGFAELLTTYGDGKVNVNAAGLRVLMTLPDVDQNVAELIKLEREGPPEEEGGTSDKTSFESVNDFFRRIPELDTGLKEYISTSSSIYRVTARGTVGGVTRRISGIAEFASGKITYLRWQED